VPAAFDFNYRPATYFDERKMLLANITGTARRVALEARLARGETGGALVLADDRIGKMIAGSLGAVRPNLRSGEDQPRAVREKLRLRGSYCNRCMPK
jgi:hypothetical protein